MSLKTATSPEVAIIQKFELLTQMKVGKHATQKVIDEMALEILMDVGTYFLELGRYCISVLRDLQKNVVRDAPVLFLPLPDKNINETMRSIRYQTAFMRNKIRKMRAVTEVNAHPKTIIKRRDDLTSHVWRCHAKLTLVLTRAKIMDPSRFLFKESAVVNSDTTGHKNALKTRVALFEEHGIKMQETKEANGGVAEISDFARYIEFAGACALSAIDLDGLLQSQPDLKVTSLDEAGRDMAATRSSVAYNNRVLANKLKTFSAALSAHNQSSTSASTTQMNKRFYLLLSQITLCHATLVRVLRNMDIDDPDDVTLIAQFN
jgi:hypothetical protein